MDILKETMLTEFNSSAGACEQPSGVLTGD